MKNRGEHEKNHPIFHRHDQKLHSTVGGAPLSFVVYFSTMVWGTTIEKIFSLGDCS